MQSLYGAIANTNKKEIMAVSIDRVYQKVLALANKEQRGYITPQEFNLFADLAQMEIFEQYFYDTNQFKRRPGNDSEYHDMVGLIDEKLNVFRGVSNIESGSSSSGFYKIGSVISMKPSGVYSWVDSVIVEEVKLEDFIGSQQSPLTRSSYQRPTYYLAGGEFRFSPPVDENGVAIAYRVDYIRKPAKPNWTYTITDGNAIFNPGAEVDGVNTVGFQNFELHPSEENSLVFKILALAGVTIKDLQLAQLAAGKEAATEQQQKQ